MMPESKPELNALIQMMNENPKYKIRLHGHTNGNYHGTIISRVEDGDFFTMGDDVKKSMGSSKKLSTERAEIIKEYLIANGIAADRMEIKAWGGKRPIHDKNGANARKNVRVEVEVLEE
jgi:outer membrane protein OmpA-like peptidoglycan-associated protein